MKKGLKEPSQIAYHSDTQSSQKTCLQRSEIGACIFSWQIAHISPAASTCMSPTIADFLTLVIIFVYFHRMDSLS